MPMLDVFIPTGALSDEAESILLRELTDLLLHHEGADPKNPAAQAIAWLFLHRPTVYVGGSRADKPRYRVVASVPEGQFDDARRAALVPAVTASVLKAEGIVTPTLSDKGRVWVFCREVPEGTWGARGSIVRLADIVTAVTGNAEFGRAHAAKRLGRAQPA